MLAPSLFLTYVLLGLTQSSSPGLRGETADPPTDLPPETRGRWLAPIAVDLAVYLPIRIVISYGSITTNATVTDMLKNDIIPAVTYWYSKALGVHRYLGTVAVSGVTGNLCNSISIPSTDQYPGFTGDIIIYINTAGTDTKTIGVQDVCLTDALRGNPLASGFILNKAFLETAQWIDIYHQMMYLFGQALGFGSNLYRNARKNGWTLYSDAEMFRTDVDDYGSTTRYLITPTVAYRASQAFLSKKVGMPITNKAGGIEWTYRALMYDLWSEGPWSMKVAPTLISLAWFQDLGWYSVNFGMGALPVIGYGVSNFLDTNCSDSATTPNSHFCSGSAPMCDVSLLSKSTCNQLNGNTSCPVAVEAVKGNCLDPSNYKPGTELEEFCPECRCFMSTLTTGLSAVGLRPICHRVICSPNSAKVRIGNALVDCPATGGVRTVQGTTGTVTCPPFSQLCPTYGCPKDCSGAGLCQQGKCVCDTGYYGDDCNSKNAPGVKISTTTPPGCVPNSIYNTVAKKCDCNVGFYYDYITKTCIACSPYCATCMYAPDLCYTCPANSNSGLEPPSGTACSCLKGFFRNSVSGKCEGCDERCDICDLGAGNCLTCKATYAYQPNGQCLCPPGTYQDTTVTPKVCKACAAGCDSCTNAAACTTCLATFFLDTGICKCQPGQYIDTVSKQCRSCHSSCLECAAAANVCTKCSTGFTVDPTYKICTYAGFTRIIKYQFPLSNWMSSDASYLIECMKSSADRDFCKPLTDRGLWFDNPSGYYLFAPNKLSPTPIILPSNLLFSLWIRPDSNNDERCMLSKVKIKPQETAILTFCLTSTNTIYLAARMRSLDLPTLGAESFIRIDTVASILHDKWAALKFRLDSAIDYMGRPGTLATILIDTMVYQQTFFPTVMFEDIMDNSDQRFIFGAKWQWGATRSPFFGYMGELAILPANIPYPSIPACGCGKCSAYSCFTDCSIYQTTGPNWICTNNQT